VELPGADVVGGQLGGSAHPIRVGLRKDASGKVPENVVKLGADEAVEVSDRRVDLVAQVSTVRG
jgi:hypothetical protein